MLEYATFIFTHTIGIPLQGTQLVEFITEHLEDMKAQNIVVLNVAKLSPMADNIIVCTGTSARHCRAVANNLLVEAKKAEMPPLGIEGLKDGGWVLLDMNDVIVHVMDQEHRDLFRLEQLWGGDSKHLNN